MNVARVAYRFPETPGLYWAERSEAPAGNRGATRSFAVFVQAGPAGVAAQPGTVPDPAAGCP